jgi:curved DNA-binding protein CbpA
LVNSSTTANLYERLGVQAGASPEELRAAFRRLSKRFHPDTTALEPAEASVQFCALQEAIEVLGDPELRRKYDLAINNSTSPSPASQEILLPERRPLSGGEWFALLLLAGALIFSLIIGVGLAYLRSN